MLGLIGKWMARCAAVVLVAAALLYMGDWAVFVARSSPRGTVSVQRVLVVPLKGNKQEYVGEGSVAQPCAQALFGQGGLDPCWQLRRHPRQEVTY
jgi:hypothetical protein